MCFIFHKWAPWSDIKSEKSTRSILSDDLLCGGWETYNVIVTYQETLCLQCNKYKRKILGIT